MNTATLLSQWLTPVHELLASLGWIGAVIWIVLKILVIAVPVIVAVAFYVVWERKLIGWMHIRHGPMYVCCRRLRTCSNSCSRKSSNRRSPIAVYISSPP